jgi:hypothetical protein
VIGKLGPPASKWLTRVSFVPRPTRMASTLPFGLMAATMNGNRIRLRAHSVRISESAALRSSLGSVAMVAPH